MREVDARPAHKCGAQIRHGAGWISPLRRLECRNCRTVIEAEEEVETLVEVFCASGDFVEIFQVSDPRPSKNGFDALSVPTLAITGAKAKLLITPAVFIVCD